jgi:PleD family two-component response regulator
MGGTIELESSPGLGSVFHFTLQFDIASHPKKASQVHQAAPAFSREALSQKASNILIAEDSDSNQALIELYFKDTTCQLDFASDGQEAIELFEKKSYDLILMDIQMAVIDGYEATR